MQVYELIEELQKHNPQAKVLLADWSGEVYVDIDSVANKPVCPVISAPNEDLLYSTTTEQACIFYPDASVAAGVK